MDSTAMIAWGLLFGACGIGYFTYGRRQGNKVALVAGLALMAFPYFVSSVLGMIMVGCVLLALPRFIKL
jgi:hypothetical protein